MLPAAPACLPEFPHAPCRNFTVGLQAKAHCREFLVTIMHNEGQRAKVSICRCALHGRVSPLCPQIPGLLNKMYNRLNHPSSWGVPEGPAREADMRAFLHQQLGQSFPDPALLEPEAFNTRLQYAWMITAPWEDATISASLTIQYSKSAPRARRMPWLTRGRAAQGGCSDWKPLRPPERRSSRS